MISSFLSDISVAPPWLWLTFTAGIFLLLLLDLVFFGKKEHKITTRGAVIESVVWITIALCFNAWFAWQFGKGPGLEFLTGYLVEKSLSVDNLFVVLLIFGSFKIAGKYQHRVLFFGVIGAVFFRALFILVGARLIHSFHWVLYFFGLVLVVTAVKFLIKSDEKINAEESRSIRLFKFFVPVTHKLDGEKFFIVEHNVRKATPLFLSLVIIEVSDIIFAIDSIPAVFSVTQDAFVAFASNILAVLGLRALYFVIADWVSRLRYLKPGLAAILGFIGIKMLLMDIVVVPSSVSLLVIFSILMTAALGSWYANKRTFF